MKQIALKPFVIQLPPTTPTDVRMAVSKAEETIRENNRIIEQTLNEIIKEVSNGNLSR